MARFKIFAALGAVTFILGACANTGTGEKITNVETLAKCPQSYGTAAIRVSDDEVKTWSAAHLQSPKKFIGKDLVGPTGCFTFVDESEPHRYVLEPHFNSAASAHKGTGAAAALAGADILLMPVAAFASFLDTSDVTVDVSLALTDTKTGKKIAVEAKANQGTKVGVMGFSNGPDHTVYSSEGDETFLSKDGATAAQALKNASAKLLAQLESQAQSQHTATKVGLSLKVAKHGHLFKEPSAKSDVMRNLPPGEILYPTGTKKGSWYEVDDHVGHRGWVANQILDPK